MRVLISTYGTRGDVQPFVALAKALKAHGHVVALCTPTGFRGMVERHGIPYAHMDNAVLELTEAVLRAPTRAEQRRLFKGFGAIVRAGMEDEWRAARELEPDVLVYHSKALGSHHIAEKLGAAELLAMPLPLTPTREFPVPILPSFRLGGWLNALSYKLIPLANAVWAGATNDFRVKTLGLAPLSRFADPMKKADGSAVPALYAYSEHLLPRPADWPPGAQVTGCWFLDEADRWTPPPELQAFLEAGPPPIYVGFGSMGAAHADSRAATVLKAVALTGERAVLASGWGGMKAHALPPSIFMLESAPHDWLFPRMSAVVHHGGAGSTMAGLRAGKPTVICPFLGDQPFWGHRVLRAGVGPQPVPQKSLTAERLSEAIRSAMSPAVLAQAAALGERIRAEDGAARAVRLIEQAHWEWSTGGHRLDA
ncbi:glycosyl transferase family protein [Corallococcus coralloides]|uniref:Glycosyl transferase family protein n=1 Tax=Corallococcus coralloides TaxID=184914 RepID=A0A410RN58_CORCK|nr:glycosyltransferase [Corallococcus coralloides]QAT83370.1 glycosyl transferase family protein [Corallococcus coralloides]